MSEKRRAMIRWASKRYEAFISASESDVGKVTVFAALSVTLVLGLGFATMFEVRVSNVNADDISTSVRVLNTPPTWTVDAQESTESSTSTPTNSGSVITWTGTGTDSSNDNYFLLICKTTTAPTANSNAPPTCGGGSAANQWAISATTTSAAQATAATTTIATSPFNAESNDWYAWICDATVSLPRCNATYKRGSGLTVSPFVINHPPIFSAVVNNGPVIPGATITWTSTATDTDIINGGNTVRLIVCKVADFGGGGCGAGGTWATSTLSTSNPATSTPIVIPTQDKVFSAFAYIIDQYGLAATSTTQATNSTFTVSNVTPSVTAATISLEDSDHVGNLTLVTPAATSGPFYVKFTVTDNNSCLAPNGAPEISTTSVNVYRSSIGMNACNQLSAYNSNNCYTASSTQFYSPTRYASSTDFLFCSQDAGSCSGATDSTATFTCTFPLWFNADATDASTQYTADNWLASVETYDDNFATSTITEASTGNELTSFLAFDVTQSSIGYGDLQPGDTIDPLSVSTTTNLLAQGNLGLDETLYGDTMCTTWTGADTCDVGGVNAGTKIPVLNQKFATSTVAYSAATALAASTTPVSFAIHVLKTIATSTIQTKNTLWAISIPSAITQSGNYTGQNTITAVKSAFAFW